MAGREQQVQQALRAQGIQIQNLEVKDHDGKVISLKGTVASADVKTRAEQVAESIPGVKVANHLSVGGAADVRLTGGRTYTVKKGDSLSAIAKEHYGDASKWKKIHEANKAQIPNPDLIHPGQVLTIPDA